VATRYAHPIAIRVAGDCDGKAQLALTAASMPTATQIPSAIPTLQPMLALPAVAPTTAVIIPTVTQKSGGNKMGSSHTSKDNYFGNPSAFQPYKTANPLLSIRD